MRQTARERLPQYRLHKASGQARCTIEGKDHYLGVFGTAASQDAYTELLSAWRSRQNTALRIVTVGELTLLYLQHCRRHYQKNGNPTSEIPLVKRALRALNDRYRQTNVNDFGPKMLTAVREDMIQAGHMRKSINGNVGRIRRMFRWGVSEELVQAMVLFALQSVRDLQAGRTTAPESPGVRPVPVASVEAIRDFVSRPVWGLINFQRYTGCRPGEALIIRGCDLNTSGAIWEYRPSSHKTQHHGRERIVAIGPKAQAALGDFLKPNLSEPLFKPSDASKRKGLRNTYSIHSYNKAIERACKRANIPGWHPNQLRHSFATEARRESGIEAARVVLGHSSVSTSEIYAERDMVAVYAIAAKIG